MMRGNDICRPPINTQRGKLLVVQFITIRKFGSFMFFHLSICLLLFCFYYFVCLFLGQLDTPASVFSSVKWRLQTSMLVRWKYVSSLFWLVIHELSRPQARVARPQHLFTEVMINLYSDILYISMAERGLCVVVCNGCQFFSKKINGLEYFIKHDLCMEIIFILAILVFQDRSKELLSRDKKVICICRLGSY